MIGLSFAVALALSAPDGGVPPRWMDLSDAERGAAIDALPSGPVQDRILAASERFVQTPYGASPLGEGGGVDPDPLIRFDLVDCLTYVEETIALAVAPKARLVDALSALRYQSHVDYSDRNHLMEAQWLPGNAAKGFVRDVTALYAKGDVQRTVKVLTPSTWLSASSRALELPKELQRVGRFPLSMIPLDKVSSHARSIPSGTLLLVIREDLPAKATRITHLGFVVQKRSRTYLRHASRNPFKRVIDEDLESFLLRNSRYEKWRVDGISLYEVKEPSPPPWAATGP